MREEFVWGVEEGILGGKCLSYCLAVEPALVRDSLSGYPLTRVGRWPSFTSYATYLRGDGEEVRALDALRPGRATGPGLVITSLLRIRTTGAAGLPCRGRRTCHFQPSDFPGGRPCGIEYRSPLPTFRERPGFSAGNTGKARKRLQYQRVLRLRQEVFDPLPRIAFATKTRVPRDLCRNSSASQTHGREPGQPPSPLAGLQQDREFMRSLVQRLSVSGKCVGRRLPCRPARLDDAASVLPSWRSTSAASVRTCCSPILQQLHGLTVCTLSRPGGFPSAGQSSPPPRPPPRTSENGTSEAGTWNLRRPEATSKNGAFIAGAASMRWNWVWNRSACCRCAPVVREFPTQLRIRPIPCLWPKADSLYTCIPPTSRPCIACLKRGGMRVPAWPAEVRVEG